MLGWQQSGVPCQTAACCAAGARSPPRDTNAGMLHMRQACLLLACALEAGVQAQTSSGAPAPASGQTIIVSQPVFQTNITLAPVSGRRSPVAHGQGQPLNWVLWGCGQHCGIAGVRSCLKLFSPCRRSLSGPYRLDLFLDRSGFQLASPRRCLAGHVDGCGWQALTPPCCATFPCSRPDQAWPCMHALTMQAVTAVQPCSGRSQPTAWQYAGSCLNLGRMVP